MSIRPRSSLLFFALALGASALLGCAPAPRSVACMNDGECKQRNQGFSYCLEEHCVECIGDTSCGDGKRCLAGRCEAQ